MKTYLIICSLLITAGLAACTREKPVQRDVALKVYAAPPVVKQDADADDKAVAADTSSKVLYTAVEAPDANQTAIVKDTAKKIIKKGELSFETQNLTKTRRAIISQLQKLGGYVSDDTQNLESDDERKQQELQVRIPAKYFDAFVDSICAGAYKIDNKHISTSDVTTQYIDMATRLQNKKTLEARYLELLKKATRMTDMLAIENKLSDIRSDIESEQGQLNYVSKQVAFSSLDITFYTLNASRPETGNGFGYRFIHSLGNGFDWMKEVFFGFVETWPLWVGLVVVVLLVRRYFKRRQERKVVAAAV